MRRSDKSPQARTVHATHAGEFSFCLVDTTFCYLSGIFVYNSESLQLSRLRHKVMQTFQANLWESHIILQTDCTSTGSILSLMCESCKCWNFDWVSHKSRRNRVRTAEDALFVKRRTSYWGKKQKMVVEGVEGEQTIMFTFTHMATGSFQIPWNSNIYTSNISDSLSHRFNQISLEVQHALKFTYGFMVNSLQMVLR